MASSLDILIAAPTTATRLADCLRALGCDQTSEVLETSEVFTVSVAHAGPIPAVMRQSFLRVRWIACDARASLPALYGRAIADSHGEWIAFLDAESPVSDRWLGVASELSLRGTVRSSDFSRWATPTTTELFGGAVEPHDLHSRAAWAAYFVDYGAFMLPLAVGAAGVVAGNNLIMRRSLLARASEFVAPQFWKSHFVAALAAQGIAAANAPSLVVTYAKNYTARVWLARRFTHGRCFAAMRDGTQTRIPSGDLPRALGGGGRTVARALVAPIVPFVMLMRLVRDVWPKRRHRREFVRALQWACAGLVAWACGEWTGYVFGAATSCEEIF